MNLEELKLILDVVQGATNGAMTIAVLWILKGYFIGLLAAGVILFIAHRAGLLLAAIPFTHTLQLMVNEEPGFLHGRVKLKITDILAKGLEAQAEEKRKKKGVPDE